MRRLVLIPRKRKYAYVGSHRPIRLQNAGVQMASDAPGLLEEPPSGQRPDPGTQERNRNQRGPNPGDGFDKAQVPDPLAEFDEYGTELHKDARVWKVYVDEADKHDTELVNGWNDSTDVILIFAALFSAISTAFLIESTKLLKPDPAEESAQSLLVISQTLSAIANGTQSPGSVPPPSSDPAEFTPSRAAVCVNVLWYLSLGLSLATSFIAILAKDWCHSFMSGRTGHPHSQMCRRQRKWNMIKKWKMSELLTILPSLIHVALLLFSAGLCIYLSDTYIVVAIPIFCATGAAIGFYIWSSIAAINIDYFPYPTIISRVCRTEVAQHGRQTALLLGSRFGSHPMIRNLYQIVIALVVVCLLILDLFLIIPTVLCYVLKMLKGPLNRCDTYLAHSSPVLQLIAIPLSKSVWCFIWYPANAADSWIDELTDWLVLIGVPLLSQLSGASWGLEWQEPHPESLAEAGGDGDPKDDVASLALSWLIINCEVPQSVDIALQSIAGATSRTDRQPLLDCHATLEILRRLASSSLYKGSGTRTDIIVSLYSRALAQLGNTAGLTSVTDQHESGSELEGLIWDLHIESERRVAASIVSGSFNPTPANLEALRIGNTAASNTLKLLGRDLQEANFDIDSVLGSIFSRLLSHVNDSESLHEAALLSLVNATALLLPLTPHSPTASSFGTLSMRVIEPRLDASTPSNLLLVNLAITCAYASSQSTHPELPGRPNSRSLLRDVVGRLLECYAEPAIPKMRSMFELETLATHPQAFRLPAFDLGVRDTMLNLAASGVHGIYNSYLAEYEGGTKAKNSQSDMMVLARVIQSPLSLVPVKSFHIFIPFLILGPIRRLWLSTYSSQHHEWAKLASDSRFPTLSLAFTHLVERSDLIPHLETMIEQGDILDRFVALGQLWLLFTVYFDASSDAADKRERLGVQLQRYNHGHSESEHGLHARIGDELVLTWESEGMSTGPLGAWPARLMECVYQSRNTPLPESVYVQLREHKVSEGLRGLSSFTSRRPPSVETKTENRPPSMNGSNVAVYNENASGNDLLVPDIGTATIGDKTDDTGVGGRASPGDSQGAICEGNVSEKLPHGTQDRGKVPESGGDPTALEGQGIGDTENRTGDLTVETGDVGNGTEGNSHVSIDMHASDKVTE